MAAYGTPEMQETARFLLLTNRFFDCLNVRSLNEGQQKNNPDLMPYVSPDDPRITVRLYNFFPHFFKPFTYIFV